MEHTGNENQTPVFSGQFQSMEDFDKECQKREDTEKAKKELSKKAKGPPPAKKQKKKAIDEDALAKEKLALEEIGTTNWVGKLNEYRSVNPVKVAGGLTFAESPSAQDPVRHTCTLTIAESFKKFGGDDMSFSNKKSAKQYAAKQAIDWLIYSNYMPADGTVKFPKVKVQTQLPPKPGSVAAVASTASVASVASYPSPSTSNSSNSPAARSWASQVPELCIRLGYDMPTYVITKASETLPLYSGYAHFPNEPSIEGKFGEVKDVHGQKKTREIIAEELVRFLKDIERQRLEEHEAEERKRKRESGSSQHEDLIDLAEKTVE